MKRADQIKLEKHIKSFWLCHSLLTLENANMELDWKPKVGMVFDSMDNAWKFWSDYGSKMGFGVRKNYCNKSKKDGSTTSCRFVCCKEGIRAKNKRDYVTNNPRHETRTDCKARIVLSHLNGKLTMNEFVEEHNHVLHLAETTHTLRLNSACLMSKHMNLSWLMILGSNKEPLLHGWASMSRDD
ncbi:protein FAR1-RELATED SEQUENCE 5-like [Senna tora]|uniref:Protein FAR1-RELATED SEQUENCE 5-like n=1 Tax=Senna tora TaxID=362788 RepID=A0A834WM54_9FABA|nr:protein FAR1-RELATED SEQUENCE 5-like [Senna tora]